MKQVRTSGGFGRRRILPMMLAMAGLWLLAGCFYLPLPEHRSENAKKDFRKLVGDANSKKPIRAGHITRAEVIAVLGPAEYASDAVPVAVYNQPDPVASTDHSAIGYVLRTEGGAWVWPLCFTAWPDKQTKYELRLVFNEQDVLDHWDVHENQGYRYWPPSQTLFFELPFQSSPKLHPVSKPQEIP